jgi:hypothetical protein
MLHRYIAYGLLIDSELELPELGEPVRSEGLPHVEISLSPVPRCEEIDDGKDRHVLWVDPKTFWLHIRDVAHYLVSEGQSISIMAEPGADEGFIRGFLLGSVSGALLLQRGYLVLHGNAIRIGDGCMICVGESGAGKSTLAAAFAKRGFDVLADDVVAIDSASCAVPGYPRIKLWQDAADLLGISTEGLMRVFPDTDKYSLPITLVDQSRRLPVRWIYQLGSDEVIGVRVETITGLDRFRLLRENTYRHEFLQGSNLLAEHLHQCSRLASHSHLSKVTRPRTGASLDVLMDMLIADVARIEQQSVRD